MAGATDGYAPHPYIGGRTAVLRALAAWRMEWPGTARVLVLTGNPGSGRSHLITGFLMLCDPEYRKRLPLYDLDPSTVPPGLPSPAVPGAAGMTAAQVVWLLAGHLGLEADDVSDVFTELAALAGPVTVVVPDVDRAGPVRTTGEPARLTRAEGDGLPVGLWARLVNALAGKDMSEVIAGSGALAGPFVQSLRQDGDGGTRTLLQLLHPAVGDEIRSGLPNVRAAQTQIAMALLEAVPEQDWGKADPYVRDHIAGHALEAGLLPQLLTDPGLFVHADPVPLRAAIEAVPTEGLGAPARTYLHTAPLLTRTQAPTVLRAALLETAFVEDGLPEYADAVYRRLGLELPWQTLWSLPVPGVSAVTVGSLPRPEGPAIPVAVLTVPANTPGAHPVGETGEENETGLENEAGRSAVLVHGLVRPDDLGETGTSPDPTQILRPSEEERAAAPLGLSRGVDYLRVRGLASQEIVATLFSDVPFTAAGLSPDGILLVATERGARALRIRAAGPAMAS